MVAASELARSCLSRSISPEGTGGCEQESCSGKKDEVKESVAFNVFQTNILTMFEEEERKQSSLIGRSTSGTRIVGRAGSRPAAEEGEKVRRPEVEKESQRYTTTKPGLPAGVPAMVKLGHKGKSKRAAGERKHHHHHSKRKHKRNVSV